MTIDDLRECERRYAIESANWHGLAAGAEMRGERGVAVLYSRRAVEAEQDRQRVAAERERLERWEEMRCR